MIYDRIKESDTLDQDLYFEILEEVTHKIGCEKAVLGCTELSLMEEFTENNPYPVVDAQSILVDRTIEKALNLSKLSEALTWESTLMLMLFCAVVFK